jgi:hypothetical protein
MQQLHISHVAEQLKPLFANSKLESVLVLCPDAESAAAAKQVREPLFLMCDTCA